MFSLSAMLIWFATGSERAVNSGMASITHSSRDRSFGSAISSEMAVASFNQREPIVIASLICFLASFEIAWAPVFAIAFA